MLIWCKWCRILLSAQPDSCNLILPFGFFDKLPQSYSFIACTEFAVLPSTWNGPKQPTFHLPLIFGPRFKLDLLHKINNFPKTSCFMWFKSFLFLGGWSCSPNLFNHVFFLVVVAVPKSVFITLMLVPDNSIFLLYSLLPNLMLGNNNSNFCFTDFCSL